MPPTQIEGQPLTILEAFASGTPVVTTRKGCIVDTVIDGNTGLYVEPGDSQAIAEALRLLLVDEEQWTRLSAAGARPMSASIGSNDGFKMCGVFFARPETPSNSFQPRCVEPRRIGPGKPHPLG
jgi:hypothetical protein